MTIRVAQWATGRVARAAVRAVLAQPGLELVGAYVWSADKAGKDLGELCGLPPLDVQASHDNLSPTVLGLMDVETSVYDPALDLFATCRSATTGWSTASLAEAGGG